MDPIILGALAGAAGSALVKSFDGPFKSLEDLWYYYIGHRTDLLRAERKEAILAYRQDILEELSKIPEENRCNPRLCVAGPAIQDSLNFIEEPDLRKMFAKLIASASDKNKYSQTHPAFSKIISQLSPFEANILHNTNFLLDSQPCCKIRLQHSGTNNNFIFTEYSSGHDIINHFYIPDTENNLENLTQYDIDLYSVIIDNLNRLGLCEVLSDHSLADKNMYTKFKNLSILNKFLLDYKANTVKIYPKYEKYCIAFIEEATQPTTIGKQFYNICVKDEYQFVISNKKIPQCY